MTDNVRIGIDVGGTFTHAVAMDGNTLDIIGKSKVPTTHRSKQGVAEGIVKSLSELMESSAITPDSVSFIAHSTTQATNALLEGDVAPVGIIGMGKGANTWLAKSATNIKNLELAPGKFLRTYHHFINTNSTPTEDQFRQAIDQLIHSGAQAIAISEAFGVDQPENENRCLAIARAMGCPATSGFEVSQLYGLKVRTRTAVINASMLPKMIESANMTESSVRLAGIHAPIMIMRSDGGVMDIDAMRKRPILTMLSGPAAGIAALMMYLRVSDGIFLEVGGTSTDISAIKNGHALVKSAEIGGHKVYIRTLDVRTVGVAGGSMARLKNHSIIDVGPRSAHIAGLGYVSFCEGLDTPHIRTIQPNPSDPKDYLAIANGELAPTLTLTPTCASNLLGLIPSDNCAFGNIKLIKQAFEALSSETGKPVEQLAQEILKLTTCKCSPLVTQLIKEYKLDGEMVTLVGGGGGAAAIVPYLAKHMGMSYTLAQNADVISAIGVALALLRETIERQIVSPTKEDLLKIRQEAYAAVHRMGADQASIEIHIEVDSKASIVRATATGAMQLTDIRQTKKIPEAGEKLALAANSMRIDQSRVELLAETDHYQIYGTQTGHNQLGGLLRTKQQQLRILDSTGIIRLQIKNGLVRLTNVEQSNETIALLAEDHSRWGDAGKIIPNFILLAGPKIIDLSGLLDIDQVLALAKIELDTLPSDSHLVIIAGLN